MKKVEKLFGNHLKTDLSSEKWKSDDEIENIIGVLGVERTVFAKKKRVNCQRTFQNNFYKLMKIVINECLIYTYKQYIIIID